MAEYVRLSYRQAMPGMRQYNPARGNPEIQAIVRTNADTRRYLASPAAMATSAAWEFTPRGGFIKVVPDDHVAAILADPEGRRAR